MDKTRKMIEIENRISLPIEVFLRERYVTELKSAREISEEIGMSCPAIKKWLHYFGIPMRSNSESKTIQYNKSSLAVRKKQTEKANIAFREKRDSGELVFNRPWMLTEENPGKQPEARLKNSEFHKKHNPMFNEDSKLKYSISMESVLRKRATQHESLFKESLRRLGYEPKFQHATTSGILDFAFVELKIGVEIDGDAHMTFPSNRERDNLRDSQLEKEGWIILRFFNSEIEDYLGECVREVIETFEANKRLLKEAI